MESFVSNRKVVIKVLKPALPLGLLRTAVISFYRPRSEEQSS